MEQHGQAPRGMMARLPDPHGAFVPPPPTGPGVPAAAMPMGIPAVPPPPVMPSADPATYAQIMQADIQRLMRQQMQAMQIAEQQLGLNNPMTGFIENGSVLPAAPADLPPMPLPGMGGHGGY